MTISKETRLELLDNLRTGMSIEAACALVGITSRTYRRWRGEDEEWRAESDHAIRLSEPILLEKLKRMAEEKCDWRGVAWVLERKFPNEWGPRQEIELNHNQVNDGGAAMVAAMILQTDERTKQLEKESDDEDV
jgi:transposase